MKQHIIKAFMGIYMAVCLVYGGVRAVYLTAATALAPPEPAVSVSEVSTFGVEYSDMPSQPTLAATAPPDPSVHMEKRPKKAVSFKEMETPAPAAPTLEPDDSQAVEAETSDVLPDTGSDDIQSELPDAAWEEPPEENDSNEESSYFEAAPAPEVPSLEEYLSQLHCGGCGRNCWLSDPRCRTGRRKAETETAVYYEEYGTSDPI